MRACRNNKSAAVMALLEGRADKQKSQPDKQPSSLSRTFVTSFVLLASASPHRSRPSHSAGSPWRQLVVGGRRVAGCWCRILVRAAGTATWGWARRSSTAVGREWRAGREEGGDEEDGEGEGFGIEVVRRFVFLFYFTLSGLTRERKESGWMGRLSGRERRDWKMANDEVSGRFTTTVAWARVRERRPHNCSRVATPVLLALKRRIRDPSDPGRGRYSRSRWRQRRVGVNCNDRIRISK